tara:strand:- start:1140 stop:2153 length:1014 start_codon:yes stop_codon:yes gene_type:complete
MGNLFKKAIVFTDLHLGLKGNSILHNEDCMNYLDWMIALGQKEKCDLCIFNGDFHHIRAAINVQTLKYSLSALERLSDAFPRTLFNTGNHDLYYRDKRDVHSVEWGKHIDNIQLINDFYSEGDVTIVPWLVGEDVKKVKKLKTKYVFGHFELPHFLMNSMITMPDTGDIKRADLRGVEEVYSGHFHKRQQGDNITYLGNAFPHDFSDAWDDERGAMILEWGEPPKFYNWEDCPKYRTFKYSDIKDKPEDLLLPNTYAQVTLDTDITYEEANYIKETYVKDYKLRELRLIPGNEEEHVESFSGEIKFESVDNIVTSEILAIESEHFDPNILLEIYKSI